LRDAAQRRWAESYQGEIHGHHDEEFLRKAAVAKDRVAQIEPRLIDAKISSGVAVIDVRESDEHAKATVPGAKNIAIGSLADKIASLVPDKSAPVIFFATAEIVAQLRQRNCSISVIRT